MNTYAHEILKTCIEELRNMSQEDFETRENELKLKENYSDKDYSEFEAIPIMDSSYQLSINCSLEDLSITSLDNMQNFYSTENALDNLYPNSAA